MNVYANESVRLLSALVLKREARLIWFSKFDRIIRDDTIDISLHILHFLLSNFRRMLGEVRLSLDEFRLALVSFLGIFVEDIVFQEVEHRWSAHHV